MNKADIKAKWLEELRSDKHTQIKTTLKGKTEEGAVGYCCLGVLYEKVLGQELETLTLKEKVMDSLYPNEGPLEAYNKINEIIGLDASHYLSDKNDKGATFKELADLIDDKWDTDEDNFTDL